MNHWIIAPIVLPALIAPILVLAMRFDVKLQRVFSFCCAAALLLIAVALVQQAAAGPPQVYQLGNWPAPFGIVLVLDRLSAVMVLLTAFLTVPVLVYAAHGWDKRGRHFHALFQFQLMGVNGAFLTGDIFNLFVFFEVLLIASYGLMLHGAGPARLKAGFQYVAVNLAGSTLFLIAVGLIYSVTGTLNMADLALKVPATAAADQALLKTGALLLLVVFGVKAAIIPLHFWLPATYSTASAPVAAFFSIMTKVGAYSILRVYTLIFGGDAGDLAWIALPWLLPAALITMALGNVGILAAVALRWMACFALIGSMGVLLTAIGLFTEPAIAASLYYLVHSTIATAALFLVVDLIAERRGAMGDAIISAPTFAQAGMLAVLFMLITIAMAGLPPLSGFVGKLLILDSARGIHGVWIWGVILSTSLLAVIGFSRVGSLLFWKTQVIGHEAAVMGEKTDIASGSEATLASTAERTVIVYPTLPLVAVAVLVASLVLLTVFAGPATDYLNATARQLLDPRDYIAATLSEPPALRRPMQ